MRRIRPLIALAAAYSITLAAAFGAISAGHSAASGISPLCLTSQLAGGPPPATPTEHDLGCCVACVGGFAVLPPPVAHIAAPIPVRTAPFLAGADLFSPSANGCSSARAPPARA